ncbi:MAG: AI-2E family transporter [Oscillospiraceae bacterium]|jgi:predicted PurR-regulated permease PerM|nr:AI-2E family transporter [Oscillospiraceae bacterium]
MKKKFTWNSPYILWGITALAVIAVGIVIYLGASHWRAVADLVKALVNILSPVIYGLVLAYLLNKPMNFFERRIFKKVKGKTPEKAASKRRMLSLFTIMVITITLLSGAISLLIPQIITSVERLVNRLPAYFNVAMKWLQKTLSDNPDLENIVLGIVGSIEDNITEWLKTTLLAQANTIVTNLTNGVIGVVGEIVNVLIGFVVAVYVLSHRETFAAQMKKLIFAVLRPKAAEGTLRGLKFLDFACGSFITSILIDSLIVGVVCYLAMTIANIPYAVLISVTIAITNLVPFFGPLIGAVPSALLLLLESPTKCLIFVIMIVVLQQVDGNIIYPRIQGTSLGLSGFWILFAILLFGGLFGFVGFLLGVPIFAVIYNAVKHFAAARLTAKGLSAETGDYTGSVITEETVTDENAD